MGVTATPVGFCRATPPPHEIFDGRMRIKDNVLQVSLWPEILRSLNDLQWPLSHGLPGSGAASIFPQNFATRRHVSSLTNSVLTHRIIGKCCDVDLEIKDIAADLPSSGFSR